MRINSHGGGCCGVRHIFNMDNSDPIDLTDLIAELDRQHNVTTDPNAGRLIEVILSSRQVGDRAVMQDRNPPTGWPRVLQEHGFRLVSRFHNANSGNDCFIFHRVPHFKSLAPADLPFRWSHEDVPVNQQGVHEAGGPGRQQLNGNVGVWNVGDRIRYTGVGALRNELGTITRDRGEGVGANRYDLRFDNGQLRDRYTSTYFERVAAAPVQPVPVVVATFYANFLRTNNARGGLYPTYAAALAAAPRCQRRDKLEILSDGTQRWTDDVNDRR